MNLQLAINSLLRKTNPQNYTCVNFHESAQLSKSTYKNFIIGASACEELGTTAVFTSSQ